MVQEGKVSDMLERKESKEGWEGRKEGKKTPRAL